MEFLFTRAAALFGQGVVGAMDNREADHTVLDSLETLIHVVLPQSQALHYTAVLNKPHTFHVSSSFSLLIPQNKNILGNAQENLTGRGLIHRSSG